MERETKTQVVEQRLRKEFLLKYPANAARSLDSVPSSSIIQHLKALPITNARAIFFRLNPYTISDLLKEIDDPYFVDLFSQVNTHLAARLLSRMEKDEAAAKLELLPDITAREIKDFLQYQIGTAGYLMETDVVAFKVDNTVEDVLQRIRKLGNLKINVVYVVSDEGELLGKVPVQSIAISQPQEALSTLMQPAPSVDAITSREDLLKVIGEEHLQQVPVTDINKNLLGVIRNETLINATKKDVTEDLLAMFGAGREEQALSKVSLAVRKRLPWLQVNLATAFLASMVVGFFEDTIAKITISSYFSPGSCGPVRKYWFSSLSRNYERPGTKGDKTLSMV